MADIDRFLDRYFHFAKFPKHQSDFEECIATADLVETEEGTHITVELPGRGFLTRPQLSTKQGCRRKMSRLLSKAANL
jgi:hypothetical protein